MLKVLKFDITVQFIFVFLTFLTFLLFSSFFFFFSFFFRFFKVLESLTENERREIASALTRKSYNTGQVIVRQGDRGDDFYIVEEGELLCTAQKSPGKKLGTIFYCCVI